MKINFDSVKEQIEKKKKMNLMKNKMIVITFLVKLFENIF